MKEVTIDWVRIPAGEFFVGLSDAQRQTLLKQLSHQGWGLWKLLPRNYALFSAGRAAISHTRTQEKCYLDDFYISRYPVTVEQYVAYQRSAGLIPQNTYVKWLNTGWGRLPIMTNYREALRFCEHLNLRFPTSNEWEKAARGVDGRFYPWGNRWNSTYGNTMQHNARQLTTERPSSHTLAMEVDSFPSGQSTYGIWDLVGNVQEFTSDHVMRSWPIKGDDRLAWLFNVLAMEYPWDDGGQGYVGFRVVREGNS